MRIWIDTEFNEHEGRHELISMALVAEDGREWYEVLPCLAPRPWVAANVMPKLGKAPISFLRFAESLQEFLSPYEAVQIIGDWPSDIALFCDALIVGPGQRINTPVLTLEVIRLDGESADPHNALADARGIRDAHLAAKPEPVSARPASEPTEGCTPADVRVLRVANLALAQESHELQNTLADLYGQVKKFCEEQGEADFYTGPALYLLSRLRPLEYQWPFDAPPEVTGLQALPSEPGEQP